MSIITLFAGVITNNSYLKIKNQLLNNHYYYYFLDF